MAEGQVSVGASLAYAWGFWRASWRMLWGVLALCALAATVQAAGVYGRNNELLVLGALAQVVIKPMLSGALFRVAFADLHPADPAFEVGHAGVQWRQVEWRLLGAQLLLGVFFVIVFALAFVLCGAVAMGILVNKGHATPPQTAEAIMEALGPDGRNVVTLVMLICGVVLFYIYGRLTLAYASTVDTAKITVLKSWPTTRGQVWRILLTLFVIGLPLTLLNTLIVAATDTQGLGGSPVMSPAAALASALAFGVIAGGVVEPMTTAALAYYYRALKNEPR